MKYTPELNFKEYCLIMALRHRFRYNEVIIMMRDGVPQHIRHAWESEDLETPILTDDKK